MRHTRLLAFLVCALSAAFAFAPPASPRAPARGQASATAQPQALAHARAALEEARAARSAGDRSRAGALAARALEQLLGGDEAALAGAAGYALANELATHAAQGGELRSALRARERLLVVLGAERAPEDPEMQKLRESAALLARELGDVERARALQREALALYEARLPADDPLVLRVCQALASTLRATGELREARELQERVVAARARSLAPDDLELARARGSLATILHELGELEAARELQEAVLACLAGRLAPDATDLQAARLNLSLTLATLGRGEEARTLAEAACASLERTLPPAHPHLLAAHLNLGLLLKQCGDLRGARAVLEAALEACQAQLGEGSTQLQLVRMNLALVRRGLGDVQAARALLEQALAGYGSSAGANAGLVRRLQANLAPVLEAAGETRAAIELNEQVVASLERDLPATHPDLATTRANLALTLGRAGELSRAQELGERALASLRARLPDEDRRLQHVRRGLATIHLAQLAAARGARPDVPPDEEARARAQARFAQLAHELVRDQLASAVGAQVDVSAREAEERAAYSAERLDDVGCALSFADGLGLVPPDPALERQAFVLSETSRAAAVLAARTARLARTDPAAAELERELRSARAELARLARADVPREDYDAAIARRDRAQRALAELGRAVTGGAGAGPIDPQALASLLGEDRAALVYRCYLRWVLLPEQAWPSCVESLCAFVLRHDGSVTRVELGPLAPVEEAVGRWPELGGFAGARGRAPQGAPQEERLQPERERALGEKLRALVLDPLLEALDGATQLVLVLDGVLHALPLDALPWPGEEGACVGDRFTLEQRATLAELSWPEAPLAGPVLLVLGGAAFDAAPEGELAAQRSEPGAAEPRAHAAALDAPPLRGSAWEGGFPPLLGSRDEARGIARLFDEAFGEEGTALVLEGRGATREAVLAGAPRARWLHLATHGWFAPGSSDPLAESLLDPGAAGGALLDEERVRGASPLVLCGLAFAGANEAPDALGRRRGLVTAEEIAGWELEGCELAVLSACDTSLGHRRAGQGVASLQRALHMAGARTVITSLWKVSDEAAAELMQDFYRRLWIEHEPKARALAGAKRRLREACDSGGAPRWATRDWAGWVLSGDPR